MTPLCCVCYFCVLSRRYPWKYNPNQNIHNHFWLRVCNCSSYLSRGSTQIIFWWDVQPEVWNSYPFLRIFLPQKWLIWCFFQNFRKLGPIAKGFSASKTADFTFFSRNYGEMGPSLRIFWLKWDPCLKNFGEKLTRLGGTSLYAVTWEYPPHPDIHTCTHF